MQMGPRDRKASTPLVRQLVRLPVVNRIKVIKDLVLNQLGSTRVEIAELQATSGTLLANNASLLEAVTSLVQILQHTRDELRQQSHFASAATHQLRENLASQVQDLRDVLSARLGALADSATAQAPHETLACAPPGRSPLFEPEATLMAHLYSFVPDRCALDVGAHVGDVSEMLLDAGFEVLAFEPYPPVFNRLSDRLSTHPAFHAYPWALGDADEKRTLLVASDKSAAGIYRDPTLYSSLVQHAMPSDLDFTDGVEVSVKTLDGLHRAGIVPAGVGLVKIDAEGFDLQVVRGMGSHKYPVVVCEYWDSHMPFGGSAGVPSLEEMVQEMRLRQYHWHIVIYRIWGHEETRYYCNYPRSLRGAWGNVFFFQSHEIFSRALEWCSMRFSHTLLTH